MNNQTGGRLEKQRVKLMAQERIYQGTLSCPV